MRHNFTKLALVAALGLAAAFIFNSCASKPKADTSKQEELELRERKGNMMKELDEGTAAAER